jgi:hypothetical protein
MAQASSHSNISACKANGAANTRKAEGLRRNAAAFAESRSRQWPRTGRPVDG